MDTLPTPWTNKKEENNYKGEKGGSWQERHALQQMRDDAIIEIVNHRRVTDHRLLAAGLGLVNSSSTLASVGRRMKRLKEEGCFNLVKQQNVTFAVTLDIPIRKKGEKTQLFHRYEQACAWHCFEAVLPLTDQMTDTEWHQQPGFVIPDMSFRAHRHGFIVEVNRGDDHYASLIEKSEHYHLARKDFCSNFRVDDLTVLWITKRPGRARKLLEDLAKIGSGGMFRVAVQDAIDIFHPETILACWFSPKTGEQEPLL